MRIANLCLALVLAAAPALADETVGPLAPGKPAGVQQAAVNNHDLFIYLSLGMTVVAVAGMAIGLRQSSGTAAVAATSTQ